MSRLFLLIHGNPQDYPPTLNAIRELAKLFKAIDVVYKPYGNVDWSFPENVCLMPVGDSVNVRKFEKSKFFNKVKSYFDYTQTVSKCVRKNRYDWVLVYDHLPMLSLLLTRILQPVKSKKVKIWYHNHDVALLDSCRRLTLNWMAKKAEILLLEKKVSLFTLPSYERLQFFSTRAKSIVLPNYPSLSFYSNALLSSEHIGRFKLLYQGAIGEGHGLLELAEFVGKSSNLELHLAGYDRSNLVQELKMIDSDKIIYHGILPYANLSALTSTCHLGLAILEPKSVAFNTAGSASNKIYEYAACGLPILYYDSEHYNKHLSKYEWAFATDLSQGSLDKCIKNIKTNYIALSNQARRDFENEFSYERVFEPVKAYFIS